MSLKAKIGQKIINFRLSRRTANAIDEGRRLVKGITSVSSGVPKTMAGKIALSTAGLLSAGYLGYQGGKAIKQALKGRKLKLRLKRK